MGHGNPSPMRLVAPAALALFGVVFLIVLFSSSGDDETGSPEETVNESGQIEKDGEKAAAGATDDKRYTVESGDTLDSIAEKTGIDVEEIQALNPDLDPQALAAGQKIKLQE